MGVHRVVGILDGVFLVLSLSESLAVAVPTRRVGHRAGETWLARCYISRPERPLFLSLARDARLGILPAGPPICERCSVSYGVPLTSSDVKWRGRALTIHAPKSHGQDVRSGAARVES